MGTNPLLRDRRGTFWYYAGLGVIRAITTLTILGAAVAAGFIWLVPVLTPMLSPEPSPSPSVSVSPSVEPSPSVSESPSPSVSDPPPPEPSPSPTTQAPTPTPEPPPPPVITTEDVEIPFETQNIEDPGLAKGKTEVRQEGVPGVRRITYTDGEQTSSVVIRNPVPRIVAHGTYVAPPPPPPPTTKAPDPPPPPRTLTLTKTIRCTTAANIRVTGSGSGVTSTTITGPANASGRTYAEVNGPAGTYTAKVTGSSPRISVQWGGTCTSS